jgi:hypothetical protein
MTRCIGLFGCLIATLCTGAAFAQVAHVYINGANDWIYGFDASSTGKLTPIAGSPFKASVQSSMAVNGKYLFGMDGADDGTVIDTYLMESNGALKKVGTTNIARFDSDLNSNIQTPSTLFLDHTGSTLYVAVFDGVTNPYLSFTIEKETGELNYTGQAQGDRFSNQPLTFSANNLFAYGAVCSPVNSGLILGYTRLSDGVLIRESNADRMPQAAPGGVYCPFAPIGAADPTGHVAFAFQEQLSGVWGVPQLATYKADSEGNLTTTSTYLNMPGVAVGDVVSLSMSPSGKLLAVGGENGLQVFHFNGASPITKFTGGGVLGISGLFQRSFWDNDNHLYAINGTTGHLHVYTITTTSAKEAAGSPYTIPSAGGIPSALAVQNLSK